MGREYKRKDTWKDTGPLEKCVGPVKIVEISQKEKNKIFLRTSKSSMSFAIFVFTVRN